MCFSLSVDSLALELYTHGRFKAFLARAEKCAEDDFVVRALVGRCHFRGHAVKKDEPRGVSIVTALNSRIWDSRNNEAGIVLFLRGLQLSSGWGRPLDHKLAVDWYEHSAKLGCALAKAGLAMAYAEGLGVRVDAVRARTLYQEAADQECVVAAMGLARLYREGLGGGEERRARSNVAQGRRGLRVFRRYVSAVTGILRGAWRREGFRPCVSLVPEISPGRLPGGVSCARDDVFARDDCRA